MTASTRAHSPPSASMRSAADRTPDKAPLVPDLDAARRFLACLDLGATEFTFQTFDDVKLADGRSRKDPTLAKTLHGSFEQFAGELADLNARGAGVFVTVNQTDGSGRRRVQNIARVRAVFHENDLSIHRIFPVPPSLIVETSPGKEHSWWLVDGLTTAEYLGVMRTLVEVHGSDKNAKDLARVLRLPGFYHRKGKPSLVRVVGGEMQMPGFSQPYSREQVLLKFPPKDDQPPVGLPLLKPAAPKAPDAGRAVTELDTPAAIERAVRYLTQEAPTALEGSGGDQQTIIVANRVLDFGIEPETALDLMAEHWNEQRADPPWDYEDLARKVANAARYRQDPIGRDEPSRHFDVLVHPPAAEPDMSVLRLQRASPPKLPMVFGALNDWILQQAEAKNAPPDYIVAGLLPVAAALIGTTRRVSPREGWSEPCILWTALVGAPSTNKSPALDAALEPLAPIEDAIARGHAEALQAYAAQKIIAQEAARLWQAEVKVSVETKAPVPIRPHSAIPPEKPVRPRVKVQDATIEALATILAQCTRGVFNFRDELSAWLGNMDRYGGNGGDRAFCLEAYGGRSHVVDRQKRDEPLRIPFLSVSQAGGIQPEKLDTLLLQDADDGLVSRFLLFWPDPVPPTRPTVVPDRFFISHVYRRLASVDFDPSQQPVTLPLTPPAADRFQAWRECLYPDAQAATGKVASALGKMPGQTLRIALVLELLSWAAGAETTEPRSVSLDALSRAICLIDTYFRQMLSRALGEAGISDRERGAALLARGIIERKPDRINLREIRRTWGLPGLKQDSVIQAAADELVEANWLQPVEQAAKHGRKRKDYLVRSQVYEASER